MKKVFRLRSVRTKIFIILFCFIGFSGILIGLDNYFYSEKEKLNKKLGKLKEFEICINKAVYYQNLVFLKDFNTPEYYQKKHTYNQVSYQNNYKKALFLIQKFRSKAIKQNNVIAMFYDHTIDELKKIDHYFKKVTYLQKLRGFRNEGMEGRMRNYAHYIEDNVSNQTQKIHLLQMRRHEKDYFLRADTLYAEKLRLESIMLQSSLSKTEVLLRKAVDDYYTTFDSIHTIDNLTGMRSGRGYNNMLNIYTSQLNYSVANLYKEYKDFHRESLQKIEYLRIFATVVILLIAIFLSAIIASSITVRIRKLSEFMNKYVENRFAIRSRFEPDVNNDEISDLIKNFRVLEHEISVQFEKYKVKVSARTEEIISQKTEIEKQNSVIAYKNEELTKQKNVLNFQNLHILDSLKAAKELQRSFFPSNDKLNDILGNFYLRFEPLDIVSGDFYWVEENEHGIFLAMADCTGHGAHGALMSINGISLLNHAVKDLGLIHTNEVLNYLSENIYQQFYVGDNNLKHTMDIAMIRIDGDQLHFSGAQRSVVILRNNELIELSGNRMPLGWSVENQLSRYNIQTFQLEPSDTVIMYTDGLTDQFGGTNGKKFKKASLHDLIKRSSIFGFDEFCEVISDSFDAWKNERDQTDDVSLLIFQCGFIDQNCSNKKPENVRLRKVY